MSGGRGLQDHLILVIMLEPVGVLAIAPVGRPARGLDIGGLPRLRPERAQRGGGVEGAGAHLHVVGLEDHAALRAPIIVQRQDQLLEAERRLVSHFKPQSVAFASAARRPAVWPMPRARSSGGPFARGAGAASSAAMRLRSSCSPCCSPPARRSPPPRDQPPAVARPALWKLADADTTIYLFGTIHVLPAGYVWENGPVRDAIAGADELVLETVIGPDPAALSALLLRMGTLARPAAAARSRAGGQARRARRDDRAQRLAADAARRDGDMDGGAAARRHDARPT